MELPVFQTMLCSHNTILTQITGDSMTGDGLQPGDIVLCEKKSVIVQVRLLSAL